MPKIEYFVKKAGGPPNERIVGINTCYRMAVLLGKIEDKLEAIKDDPDKLPAFIELSGISRDVASIITVALLKQLIRHPNSDRAIEKRKHPKKKQKLSALDITVT